MKLTITEVGVCAFAWGGTKGTGRRGCPESLQEGVREGEASDGDWEEREQETMECSGKVAGVGPADIADPLAAVTCPLDRAPGGSSVCG